MIVVVELKTFCVCGYNFYSNIVDNIVSGGNSGLWLLHVYKMKCVALLPHRGKYSKGENKAQPGMNKPHLLPLNLNGITH